MNIRQVKWKYAFALAWLRRYPFLRRGVDVISVVLDGLLDGVDGI